RRRRDRARGAGPRRAPRPDRRPGNAGPAHRAGAVRVRGARLPRRLGVAGVPAERHPGRRAAPRRHGGERALPRPALLPGNQGGERPRRERARGGARSRAGRRARRRAQDPEPRGVRRRGGAPGLRLMRVAPEGWPFIAGAWLIAAGLAGMRWWIALAIWLPVAIWVVAFFRDPVRDGPRGDDVVLAPADGLVVSVIPIDEPAFLRGPATRISIF